jgi:hypothetical protein
MIDYTSIKHKLHRKNTFKVFTDNYYLLLLNEILVSGIL